MRECPDCGEMVERDERYCPECDFEFPRRKRRASGASSGGESRPRRRRRDEDDEPSRPRRRSSSRSKPGRGRKSAAGSRGIPVWAIILIAFAGMLCIGGGVIAVWKVGGEAVGQAENAAFRVDSKNNLKKIGLGGNNYHDTVRRLPINGVDAEKRTASHSWTTRLLPYLDQQSTANRIKMQMPWNHPSNAQAMSQEVQVMLNKSIQEKTVNSLGAAHYAGNTHIFPTSKVFRIRDTTDGSSNTIWIGEVNGGLRAWGDPSNVRDPSTGIGGGPGSFGGTWGDKAMHFLLLDGSARFVSSKISQTTLRALATPAGGEVVGEF